MNDFYYEEKNGVRTLKCAALSAVKGLRHGFSTRLGGVSAGDCAAMNFSRHREPLETVEENYRRFCAANGLPFDSLALTSQTHTAHVAEAGAELRRRGRTVLPEGTDGVFTAAAGLGLVCFTADCVPILLAEPAHGLIAAVHSGWRGTVERIAAEAVHKMCSNGAKKEQIIAAIGPSIGPCCFEIGSEVKAAFDRAFGAAYLCRPSAREGHFFADLWEANRLILEDAGLLPQNVHLAGICTCCEHDLYFSHRFTQGRRGSLIAAIAREERR